MLLNYLATTRAECLEYRKRMYIKHLKALNLNVLNSYLANSKVGIERELIQDEIEFKGF